MESRRTTTRTAVAERPALLDAEIAEAEPTTAALVRRPAPTVSSAPIAAAETRETALAPAAMPTFDPYVGIAVAAFTDAQRTILSRPVDLAELDILPTGEIYLSQIGYRRRLFEAFGAGGWGLRPLSKPTMSGTTLMQEMALYVGGRFVSSAWGEADYQERNSRTSYATAAESLKSNALMRCCKDIGIASECWDRRFTSAFVKEHCVKVWREKAKQGAGEYQWRRRDADPFYDERGGAGEQPPRARKAQAQQQTAPAGVDPVTGEDHTAKAQARKAAPVDTTVISDAQRQRLWTIARNAGWTEEELKHTLLERFNLQSTKDIPRNLYDEICTLIEHGTGADPF